MGRTCILALALLSCLAVPMVSARVLLDDSCPPVADSTGDPTSVVPKGYFSIILAPYLDPPVVPQIFVYGSEDELRTTTLQSGGSGPGDFICWLKDKYISVDPADSFLQNVDYQGTITRKGEVIQFNNDARCTIGIRKKYTDANGNTADTDHGVRCLLPA